MIVTFYSFKGGVGRSMAVANVAEILANRGYRVIVCDWDLEAPGLERYFIEPRFKRPDDSRRQNPFMVDPRYEAELDTFQSWPGLLDLLLEYKETMSSTAPPRGAHESENFVRFGDIVLRRPSSYARETPWHTERRGSVRLLTAGRRDGSRFEDYAEGVRNFNWREFYDLWAGAAWLDFFREDLLGEGPNDPARAADIVLIDSRTGVTEQSGVCTHHLADVVALFSAPNRANIDGTLWMTRALRSDTLKSARTPPKLLPVASRVEIVAEKEMLADFDVAFRQGLAAVTGEAVTNPDNFLKSARVPYVSFYSFQEAVVAREPEHRRNQVLYDAYVALTDAIEECGVASELLLPRLAQPQAPAAINPNEVGPIIVVYGERARRMAASVIAGFSAVRIPTIWEAPDPARPVTWLETWDERLKASGKVVLVTLDTEMDRRALNEILSVARTRLTTTNPIRLAIAAADSASSPNPLPPPVIRLSSDATTDALHIARHLLSDASILGAFTMGTGIPPHPGLREYDEATSAFFAGRDAEIFEAIRRLTERPAERTGRLIVEGPSHCGKSSFIHAGLLPALRRVTDDPLGIIRLSTVERSENRDDVRDVDVTWQHTIESDVRRAVLAHQQAKRSLVFVVQWNNAFGSLDHRTDLERILRDALERNPANMLIAEARSLDVGSLSSFLGNVQPSEVLTLAPLPFASLRQAIEVPVLVAGGAFEDGLIDRIASDALPYAGSLGVISHAMHMLWQRRRGQVITHDAYSLLGGVEGIFIREADALAESLRGPELQLFRDLLLVVASRDTDRWEETFSERLEDVPLPENSDAVVGAMSARGIIQVNRGGIELVDDRAVLRWRRFTEYRDLDEAKVRKRRRLEADAKRWYFAGQRKWALPSDEELMDYVQVTHRSSTAERFLTSARRWQRIRRAGTRLSWTGLGVLVVALIALMYQRHVKKTDAATLLAASQQVLAANPTESLRRALQAATRWDSEETRGQIVKAALKSRLIAELKTPEAASFVALPAGGSELLAVSETMVGYYELRTGRRLFSGGENKAKILTAAATQSGTAILLVTAGAPPAIWHSGEANAKPVQTEPMTSGAFSRDGRKIVVSSALLRGARATLLFDTDKPSGPSQILFKNYESSVGLRTEFSAVGDRVVTTGNGGWVTIWNAFSREKLTEVRAHGEAVPFLAISDGGTAVTATAGGSIQIWDVTSAEARNHLTMPPAPRGSAITAMALSPDGATLLACNDAEVRRFATTGPDRDGTLLQSGGGTALAFSPDAEQLAVGRPDGTLIVTRWRDNKHLFTVRAHEGTVQKIVYSADGRRLATSGADRSVRVWDTGPPPIAHKDADAIEFGMSRLPVRLLRPHEAVSETLPRRSRTRSLLP